MLNIIQLVQNGLGKFELAEICSTHNNYSLFIKVFRDALKFDNMPEMTWNRSPILDSTRKFSGVRLPATAHEMQQIADLLGCMLLTPKIIDLIWLQAKIKFDSVININGKIVALSNIHDVHQKIESEIEKAGGDNKTDLISCVGKYWCLVNELLNKPIIFGEETACNYGWFAKKASGPGITSGTQCWQRPGFKHNKKHLDPSQTIKLMFRQAKLISPNGNIELVDLHDIAGDKNLAPLIHHQGVLKCLRQPGVPELDPIKHELTKFEVIKHLKNIIK